MVAPVAPGTSGLNSMTDALSKSSTVGVAGTAAAVAGGSAEATIEMMNEANIAQNLMAAKSMEMQMMATIRSMLVQIIRDLVKDAKDTVKDQGEAGHKP